MVSKNNVIATPATTNGTMIGSVSSIWSPSLPRKAYRSIPNAAIIERMTVIGVATRLTFSEVSVASITSSSWITVAYHFRVYVSGGNDRTPSLANDISTTTPIGIQINRRMRTIRPSPICLPFLCRAVSNRLIRLMLTHLPTGRWHRARTQDRQPTQRLR
jgi:hypothetical protein